MKRALSVFLFALMLLAGGVVAAADSAAEPAAVVKYQALVAAGSSELDALRVVLQEFGADVDQVSAIVSRAAIDTGSPEAVVEAAVSVLEGLGSAEAISTAVDAALATTTSPEQATAVASRALNAISGVGESAEAARQAVTNSALASNVDPASLLEATAALGARDAGQAADNNGDSDGGQNQSASPPFGGDGGAGAPGGGSGGGGVGSLG
jgi:hypothetical protein